MLGVARRLAAISAAIRKNLWSWAGVLIGFRMRSIHQPYCKIAGRHQLAGAPVHPETNEVLNFGRITPKEKTVC